MPELELRLRCSVCLGAPMQKLSIGGSRGVTLDHCRRCGSVWFGPGELARMRRHRATELWKHVSAQPAVACTPCHSCHAPLDRQAERCAGCGWKNRIDCPACGCGMKRRVERGTAVDVCPRCAGVWLDHAEIAMIWSAAAAALVAAHPSGPAHALAPHGAEIDGEVLVHSPELAVHAARATADLASTALEVLRSAPEAALGAGEVMAEAAGAVFGLILEILAGLLDGL